MISQVVVAILSMSLVSIDSTRFILVKNEPSSQIECARAIPKSIVNKSIFPNTKFVLKKDANRVPYGLETLRFNNGDKLVITHTGCESYILNFQFETSQFAADITDTKYWFARSIQLMRQTEKGIETPTQIHKGIQALKKYSKTERPEIGKEIDYGGKDIRSVVSLIEVKKLENKKFVVTVNFYDGPL